MYAKSKQSIIYSGGQYIYNQRPTFEQDTYQKSLELPRSSPTTVQRNTTLNYRGTYGKKVHLCHHLAVGYLGEMLVDYLNGKSNMMYFWGNIACVINPEWRQIFSSYAPKYIHDLLRCSLRRFQFMLTSRCMSHQRTAQSASNFLFYLNNITTNLSPGNASTNMSIKRDLDPRLGMFNKFFNKLTQGYLLSHDTSAALTATGCELSTRNSDYKSSISDKVIGQTSTGNNLYGYDGPIYRNLMTGPIHKNLPFFKDSPLHWGLLLTFFYLLYYFISSFDQ